METIITIKRNKPAYKALILLAREFEKNDNTSITIRETRKKKKKIDLILPSNGAEVPFTFFDQLSDFPTIGELREKAWPKVL
jgi:hypothetical protein